MYELYIVVFVCVSVVEMRHQISYSQRLDAFGGDGKHDSQGGNAIGAAEWMCACERVSVPLGKATARLNSTKLLNYDTTLVKLYMLIVQSARNWCYFRFVLLCNCESSTNTEALVFHTQETFQTQR